MRTETIPFHAFMSGEYKQSANNKKVLQSLKTVARGSIVIIFTGITKTYAYAESAIPASTKSAIIHAFDPLIELMIDLSLPIAGIMLTGGALMIMIGQKDKGFSLIMNASLGYVLVNLTPLFLTLLESIGKAL